MSGSKTIKNAIFAIFAVATLGVAWMVLRGGEDPSKPITPYKPQGGKPTNVLFITIDTLRADHLGAYGHEQAETPVLDALAEQGTLFTQATVPFPRTTPALASLHTGLWPHHHGSREVWNKIKHGKMLAEVLSEHGFDTRGVSANSAAGAKQHFDRGFDEFVSRKQLGREQARTITKTAIDLIANADPDKPLFLWAHYVDPHWPYKPPKAWTPQPQAPKCRALMNKLKSKALSLGQLLANHNDIASPAKEDCSKLYDSEIAYSDNQVGKLIEALKKADRWDNSLIVFTSDHGENMGEEGLFYGHGPSLNDASMRVPLILVGPGIPAGKTDSSVTRIEDLMPTVLEMLRIDRASWPKMDGTSLAWRWDETAKLPEHPVEVALAESGTPLRARAHNFLISGRPARWCINGERYSVCSKAGAETFYDRTVDPKLDVPLVDPDESITEPLRAALKIWKPETARRRAARTTRFKLVEYPKLQGGYRRVMYDLTADPAETRNVIDDHPDVAKKLLETLGRWASDLPLYEARERSPEEIEELRALGYIQ